jgi:hypothetical protein
MGDMGVAGDATAAGDAGDASSLYRVQTRIGAGHDPHALIEPVFDRCGAEWRLRSLGTARQGTVLDCVYTVRIVRLNPGQTLAALLWELNRIEGVQSVEAAAEGGSDSVP